MTGKYPRIRLYRTIEDEQYRGLRESVSLIQPRGAYISLHGSPNSVNRELAQVLEPWLYRSPEPFWWRGTLEEMRRWERRFLD
jgi:hypothetical protein